MTLLISRYDGTKIKRYINYTNAFTTFNRRPQISGKAPPARSISDHQKYRVQGKTEKLPDPNVLWGVSIHMHLHVELDYNGRCRFLIVIEPLVQILSPSYYEGVCVKMDEWNPDLGEAR